MKLRYKAKRIGVKIKPENSTELSICGTKNKRIKTEVEQLEEKSSIDGVKQHWLLTNGIKFDIEQNLATKQSSGDTQIPNNLNGDSNVLINMKETYAQIKQETTAKPERLLHGTLGMAKIRKNLNNN